MERRHFLGGPEQRATRVVVLTLLFAVALLVTTSLVVVLTASLR